MKAAITNNIIAEVTQRCNGQCLYCYNVWKGGEPYPGGELGTHGMQRLLKKAVGESGARVVTLTGGEPLLRDDLEEISAYLKGLRADVNIITNGTLMTDERAKRLTGTGVSVFELPLLSARRETQNALMRCDAFDPVTRAIVALKKYGAKVVTVFVATKANIADVTDAARLAFALGADGIMFNRFNPGGEGAGRMAELMPSAEELERALAAADAFAAEYKMPVVCSIPIQPCIVDTEAYKNLNFGFCSAGTERSYYTIDPTGNVRMCNHSRIILGNLLEEPFSGIVSKEAARDFVSAVPERCMPCHIRDKCLGGCKAAAEACYGSCREEEPFLLLNAGRHVGETAARVMTTNPSF